METTTIIKKPITLEMIKSPSSFKLIVSEELENKIRYYLGQFPNIEYSGTLFYTVTGDFENKDLVVNAIDFLLQDIGTGGYTEFEQSPDVISYMVQHPELLGEDIYQGLMHSHHTMGAFFSGTDIATLREEGSDRTHFVSLIIDTKGTYQAAITRIIEEEMEATGVIKYKTFNDVEKSNPRHYTFKRTRLEYFMLNVERPAQDNPFQELSDRIAEVRKQKSEKAKQTYNSSNKTSIDNNQKPIYDNWQNRSYPSIPSYQTNVGRANIATPVNKNYIPPVKPEEPKLPFEEQDMTIPYGEVRVSEEIIDDLAKQLVTGDIAYFDYSNASLDELAIASEELFDQRFTDIKLFNIWAEQYIEFLVYYTEDATLMMEEDDTIAALIAYDLREILDKIKHKNKYIEQFITTLEKYII